MRRQIFILKFFFISLLVLLFPISAYANSFSSSSSSYSSSSSSSFSSSSNNFDPNSITSNNIDTNYSFTIPDNSSNSTKSISSNNNQISINNIADGTFTFNDTIINISYNQGKTQFQWNSNKNIFQIYVYSGNYKNTYHCNNSKSGNNLLSPKDATGNRFPITNIAFILSTNSSSISANKNIATVNSNDASKNTSPQTILPEENKTVEDKTVKDKIEENEISDNTSSLSKISIPIKSVSQKDENIVVKSSKSNINSAFYYIFLGLLLFASVFGIAKLFNVKLL